MVVIMSQNKKIITVSRLIIYGAYLGIHLMCLLDTE